MLSSEIVNGSNFRELHGIEDSNPLSSPVHVHTCTHKASQGRAHDLHVQDPRLNPKHLQVRDTRNCGELLPASVDYTVLDGPRV